MRHEDDDFESDNDDTDSGYSTVNKAELESISQQYDFEAAFYKHLAGSCDDFQVIPIPDEHGNIPTAKDLEYFNTELKKQGVERVLYRVSFGKFALVYNAKDLTKIGVIPETELNGFVC